MDAVAYAVLTCGACTCQFGELVCARKEASRQESTWCCANLVSQFVLRLHQFRPHPGTTDGCELKSSPGVLHLSHSIWVCVLVLWMSHVSDIGWFREINSIQTQQRSRQSKLQHYWDISHSWAETPASASWPFLSRFCSSWPGWLKRGCFFSFLGFICILKKVKCTAVPK